MSDPSALAHRFLKALEARDLPAANACLAPDVQMVFPGGAVFTSLDDLIAWARPRYRQVAKRIDRTDVCPAGDSAVVVCQGTLYGTWPDGTAFQGIRFADWFEIRDGLIHRQHVWNDLAEVRGAPRTRNR